MKPTEAIEMATRERNERKRKRVQILQTSEFIYLVGETN
jgi:hypothetical protein